MLKKSVSLINNASYEDIKKIDLDGIEIIANKHSVSNDTCSIQSLFYGCAIGKRIPEDVDAFVEFLKPTIDDANKVGANLVFGSPKLRSCYDSSETNKLILFFNEINNLCKNSYLAIEPNAPIYGGNNLITTEETIKFIRSLNMPRLKLNLDLGTLYFNNDSFDLIGNNIDIINHVHISAPNLVSIKNVDINFYKTVLKILDECKYNKFISLESLEKDYNAEVNYFLTIFD